ncbi:hypothetical protein H4J50_06230 [Colwellia sp. 6M3]|jgi:hypothetical protein|nr:hypothetical protein [Colwellia sp. 6M3]MBA6415607.1 hypothetical protein [Colwellia sp. 6M3]
MQCSLGAVLKISCDLKVGAGIGIGFYIIPTVIRDSTSVIPGNDAISNK